MDLFPGMGREIEDQADTLTGLIIRRLVFVGESAGLPC